MNPRHAATLALVGWYLMVPPTMKGDIDENASISKWKTFGQLYDTAAQCIDFQNHLRERTKNDRPPSGVRATGKQRFAKAILFSECVSTDDPRHKQP